MRNPNIKINSVHLTKQTLSLQTNFQKGGLDKISTFKGGLLRNRGSLFSGGCNFHIKNKSKSEIFNDKKS